MCRHSSPVGDEEEKQKQSKKRSSTRIKIKKTTTTTTKSESNSKIPSNLGPSSRKMRTKTRRPKFLSLKLQLNSTCHDNTKNKANNKKPRKQNNKNKKTHDTTPFQRANHQHKLFPLEPDTLTEKDQYDAVAAYLFNSGTDGSAISSIHDLLDSSCDAATAVGNTTVSDCCGGGPMLSPYDRPQDHGSPSSSSLVRTAMRRGASEDAEEVAEERWVSYSEVVEEVMSRSGTPRWYGEEAASDVGRRPSLALKLDYEQIMEAWSDKGPLYIDGEPPQTVPDLYAAGGCATGEGSVWAVPEMEGTERQKRGQREASLLRYKEKRQSRLFAKRIRYEVRKLNAEKRPRIKGRFVKRFAT